MAIPTLESLTAALDRTCADGLGDIIQYRAAGASTYLPVRAHVDYRDMLKSFEGSAAIAQEITVSIPKAYLPAKPSSGVRIQLSLLPGQTFKPISARNDESGTHWEFDLQDVIHA